MAFPSFYTQAPRIIVRDALGQFLGATDDGLLEYQYADAVRLAGHSCPTVAGAYLSTRAALQALYPKGIPERGGIAVRLPAPITEGVMGVIAQICTLITGAAAEGGFKGLAGRHRRAGLLAFAPESEQNDGGILFKRIDTGKTVSVVFDASTAPISATQREHMAAAISGKANAEEQAAFAAAWQERVEALLTTLADDPNTVRVRSLN